MWNNFRPLAPALIALMFLPVPDLDGQSANPLVRVVTPVGEFSIELFEQAAPVTVANFLKYVNDGDYNDAIVHRSVPGFVIQTGGFVVNSSNQVALVPEDPPIVNEPGISNTRGTVAMAKLGNDPNSATSEWFVNLADNSANLDNQNGGFTVFGQVIGEGMTVVDAIAALPRFNLSGLFTSAFDTVPTINFNGNVALQKEHLVLLERVEVVDTALSTTAITPSPAMAGSSTLLAVVVTPAGNPASTGITVTADLSSVGGSASEPFFDDGTKGDVTPGDHTFSFLTAILPSTAAGTAVIPVTVRDAEQRTATASLSLTILRTPGADPFTLTDRGGNSTTSSGGAPAVRVGYGRIEPDAGRTTPSGLAIFGLRQNGILVTEAGVPAAPRVTEGRIFAEVGGAVNTGLAIANPNDVDATISFHFTGVDGVDFGGGTLTLGAYEQTARFLNEAPFNGGEAVEGTFTFASSVPVSVIALRGVTNARSEFLITTLPVVGLSASSADTIYFPHFADGMGWTTQVILVNPTNQEITGTVQFLGTGEGTTPAEPLEMTLDDESSGTSFSYSIPGRSARRLTTANPDVVSVGSVRATADSGSAAPEGLGIFSLASDGVTVSGAGVPALREGTAFRVYVEVSGTAGEVGSIRSGMAITDASGTANTVTLELTGLDGAALGSPATIDLPPSGQVAGFVDEFFTLPDDFAGVLRITSISEVAVIGLRARTNERFDFLITTTPPSKEGDAPAGVDTFFPHFVDSEGWRTQFVVFSGTSGQASSGVLNFVGQNGEPLDLVPE